jgi:hypothetical protein
MVPLDDALSVIGVFADWRPAARRELCTMALSSRGRQCLMSAFAKDGGASVVKTLSGPRIGQFPVTTT